MFEVAGNSSVSTYFEMIGADGRHAHAYLFVGPHGVGKSTVARAWAQQLLAHDGPLNTHPDYYELDPSIPDSPDPIDLARAFTHFMSEKPFFAARKVAFIRHAELLTPASCDALLKTIEEPAGESVMIIAVSHQELVPATIRSRCQMVAFAPVQSEEPRDERHVKLSALLADTPSARMRWVAQQFGRAREAEEKRFIAHELVAVFEQVVHDACGRGQLTSAEALIKAFAGTRHALAHNVSPQMAIEQLVIIQ